MFFSILYSYDKKIRKYKKREKLKNKNKLKNFQMKGFNNFLYNTKILFASNKFIVFYENIIIISTCDFQ